MRQLINRRPGLKAIAFCRYLPLSTRKATERLKITEQPRWKEDNRRTQFKHRKVSLGPTNIYRNILAPTWDREQIEEAQMVTMRRMDEQHTTREMIAQMQEQMQAQARAMQEQLQAQARVQQEMQRKHEEDITMLRNEWARREQYDGTRRDQEQSHHTNPNGNPNGNANLNSNTNGNTNPNGNANGNTNLNGNTNGNTNLNGNPNGDRRRREPTPLQTIRPIGLIPLTAAIMQAPMSEKAPPTFDKYDDSTDPDDHMKAFSFFIVTQGEALSWYNTLPPNTVDCFSTVQTLFGRQHASKHVQELTAAKLVNTKKEKGESLKAFMKRYTEIARQIKEGRHSFNSSDKNEGTFHKDFVRTPRVKVLEEALNTELLTIRKKSSLKDADERKNCQFHQNRGHTTVECFTLKDEIERLIRGGHMQKFVEERTQTKSHTRE
ncbi:hypothetical protein V8G54_019372 [Vigna mungo]|uniref:Retrotransposon gag domain-containing protein n=1 Tax=Vigna mungo TaxID=3915 RepID=A0AAQ3NAR8_VIGMU